ncbi:hypothetical protein [Flavobacterium suzhouense]|uniref:Knr4/Smi1-like domain-containing protein n=1 Tax=Flavobacterium suzhouense TaxID=1529638 RepID=A0ABW5NZH0_9FLAO
MEIEYLKELQKNPYRSGKLDLNNEPIPESEIIHLEQLYNQGKTFPKALRELLHLAGNFCYVLDYGVNESQEELQEYVREKLDFRNKIISRPFFVIDIYNVGTQCLFVYLDEGNNPPVYEGFYSDKTSEWIRLISYSLSKYIDTLLVEVKEGKNPF